MTELQDEEAIRNLMTGMEDAWNRHDMKAWSAPFTDDADFVNVAGVHRKGRAAIEALHVEQHRDMLKHTRQRYKDVRIKFLTPDVAVVHRYWSLSAYTDGAGTLQPSHDGIAVHMMLKKEGAWLISAFQNTIVRE